MTDLRQRKKLLQVARDSLAWGINKGVSKPVDVEQFESELQQPAACFVTLHRNDQLRGCIGSLEARRPLVEDVSKNAFAAGFQDPRFPALQEYELDQLDLSISVLTPAQEMHFTSQQDLIKQLKPGIDGLILEEGQRRGTFLPSVWEQLPDPEQFLHHLKLKAGLPVDYWSDKLRVFRYTTESFE
jgi:AmmeMemoRadiSam system protein A